MTDAQFRRRSTLLSLVHAANRVGCSSASPHRAGPAPVVERRPGEAGNRRICRRRPRPRASPKFVPPAERIATFDQDGTLWVEHPMYTQVMYCLERVPAVVARSPS